MYYFLIFVHVIVRIFLMVTILLQAGRGGGLTESMGDSAQSVLGTQAPTVLKRATEVGAVLFLVLSLVLGMMTTRRGRSLFENVKVPVPGNVKGVTQPIAQPQPESLPDIAPDAVPETEPVQ